MFLNNNFSDFSDVETEHERFDRILSENNPHVSSLIQTYSKTVAMRGSFYGRGVEPPQKIQKLIRTNVCMMSPADLKDLNDYLEAYAKMPVMQEARKRALN